MIQKSIIPHKIKTDPNSTSKPQTMNLDLKPYNKLNKNPHNKNPYNNPHNIHLHASTPHLVSEHRIKTNKKIMIVGIKLK